MGIKELRDSGLLELYVLGQCSSAEEGLVEKALVEFPELKNDLYQIGGALEQYAQVYKIQPSLEAKGEFIKRAKNTKQHKNTRGDNGIPSSNSIFPAWLSALLGLGVVLLGYMLFNTNNKLKTIQSDYERARIICDSIQQQSDLQFAQLNLIEDASNQVLPITPTDNYSETDIYLIYNENTRQNFVQIANLPEISDQQSFQLWSLKPDLAPIPLTVFQGDESFVIPVEYEEGTATYAITIEPFGGLSAPTLSNLIGTVNIPA